METSKLCPWCQQIKPLSGFYKARLGKDGRETKCIECRRSMNRANYLKNHDSLKAKHNAYNEKTKRVYGPRRKELRLQQKAETLAHYSPDGLTAACSCCGETELSFLTIDHIENGGSKHRSDPETKNARYIHTWLKQQGWPEGYQTLCMNCNLSRRINDGVCAHKLRATA